jgi:hypothetical protein
MRNRRQQGQIIRIGNRWYVRYWERRNIGGSVERKRVTHSIGEVMTREKRPPADIKTEAERHISTVNSGTVPAERIVSASLSGTGGTPPGADLEATCIASECRTW